MTIPLIILALALALCLFIRHALSVARDRELGLLEMRRKNIREKHDFILAKKKELTAELADKERELATLRNSGEGIKAISTRDLETTDVDENEKASRYLLAQGKITLEQNQKAFDKMNTLQMDYLAVCLTMGFIDLETAKAAAKVGKKSK
jgi:F0F1-type ATP synthase membrane subunit b/b'